MPDLVPGSGAKKTGVAAPTTKQSYLSGTEFRPNLTIDPKKSLASSSDCSPPSSASLVTGSDRAMDMEIQQVPWWNRRSRMERRFFVVAVSLLCVTIGLALGLMGVLYKGQSGLII